MKTKKVPFDINKAQAGAKVVTRCGLSARITDYAIKDKEHPILGLVDSGFYETPETFTNKGRAISNNVESDYDLFIEEEEEETDDYNPYKATVESISDMVERYADDDSDLEDFYGEVKSKCRAAIAYDNAWKKQGKQKTADNKPKFHKGDWVIDKHGIVKQITDVRKNIYKPIYEYSTISYSLGILSYGYFSENVKDIRLWDIKDAKNGDVLVNGSNIFIFHFINDTRIMGYCHVNIDDDRFYNDLGKNECFGLIDAIFTPATKEQCDLLFQKMKEAGYEWNSDKKELHKIEEVKKRRMTYQELSWWLREHPEEHREMTYSDEDNYVSSDISYLKSEAKIQVNKKIVIRKNGGEWQEPLIEL